MSALLDELRAAGIALEALPGGKLHAVGPLTDETRAAIREQKAAILAELAAANDTTTPEQAAELRELVTIVAADWSKVERAEALAVALADANAALICFRALVAERSDPPSPTLDNGMRTCTDCANLSQGGRCLAAWRGESFGPGIAISRNYAPPLNLPLRCVPYRPGPDDPDRRTGVERWPWLVTSSSSSNYGNRDERDG